MLPPWSHAELRAPGWLVRVEQGNPPHGANRQDRPSGEGQHAIMILSERLVDLGIQATIW
jgi:hypothetical protein